MNTNKTEIDMKTTYKTAVSFAETYKPCFKIAAGFDGFIDILVKPIMKKKKDGHEYFSSIASFGEYLISKSSMSSSIELETITEKIGGNMPIYAHALTTFGLTCDCIGTLGLPNVKEIFSSLSEHASLTSVGNPGHCTALEFSDGKVMLARNSSIDELDYNLLIDYLGTDRLINWMQNSDAVALLNWSEMRGVSSIWRGLLDHILPKASINVNHLLIIDVSDCSCRCADEIREMTELISKFSHYFRVVFSMNYNEVLSICQAFDQVSSDIPDMIRFISEKTNVKEIVIHLLDRAFVFDDGKSCIIPGKRIEAPLLTTGGGDNFNAGLTLGLLGGLYLQDAVALANAAGGFYVVNGRSASIPELHQFIYKYYWR